MVDVSASLALLALAAVALGEWIHARHVDAASVLAFGPSGRPRRWTRVAPAVRTLSAALFVWGSATLALSPSSTITIDRTTSERLLVLLDVSPSMYLEDAGSTEPVTRLSRARSTLRAILDRTAPEVPISVGAFYNELKPIVVDTTDRNILENVCNRLPLTQAFTGQRAKTNLTGVDHMGRFLHSGLGTGLHFGGVVADPFEYFTVYGRRGQRLEQSLERVEREAM